MREHDYFFKIRLFGDTGVGKSCLLLRFADGTYSESYISSISVDFKIKTIKTTDDKLVKLQIWDTCGQERFRTIESNYARGAQAYLAIYDVTDQFSFENIKVFVKSLLERFDYNEPIIMLVGTKCDLVSQRVVDREHAERFAKEFDLPFIETSARNDINIDQAFSILAKILVAKYSKEEISRGIPERKQTSSKEYIQGFLSELKLVKEQLKADCQSSFTFSLDRKRIGFQALNALEISINDDQATWAYTPDPHIYIKTKIENIKKDPAYLGVEGGIFNPTDNLFSKYSTLGDDAQEGSCVIA